MSRQGKRSLPAARETALFIGRFQPFHKGHYFSIKTLLSRYGRVVIGIGSSDKSHTKDNPFTFKERKRMLAACFSKAEQGKLTVIAIPDTHDDSRWVAHVLSLVPGFSCAYSNNPWVRRLFKEKGVCVRTTGWHDRKNCMAKRIRERIACGDGCWKRSVPLPAVTVLKKITGEERIKKLFGA